MWRYKEGAPPHKKGTSGKKMQVYVESGRVWMVHWVSSLQLQVVHADWSGGNMEGESSNKKKNKRERSIMAQS